MKKITSKEDRLLSKNTVKLMRKAQAASGFYNYDETVNSVAAKLFMEYLTLRTKIAAAAKALEDLKDIVNTQMS